MEDSPTRIPSASQPPQPVPGTELPSGHRRARQPRATAHRAARAAGGGRRGRAGAAARRRIADHAAASRSGWSRSSRSTRCWRRWPGSTTATSSSCTRPRSTRLRRWWRSPRSSRCSSRAPGRSTSPAARTRSCIWGMLTVALIVAQGHRALPGRARDRRRAPDRRIGDAATMGASSSGRPPPSRRRSSGALGRLGTRTMIDDARARHRRGPAGDARGAPARAGHRGAGARRGRGHRRRDPPGSRPAGSGSRCSRACSRSSAPSVEFDDLGGRPLLGVRGFGLSPSSRVLKRAFDLVVATSSCWCWARRFLLVLVDRW